MADSKILNHPDREEIIQKLVSGLSPNKVNDWLNEKYSKEEDKHNRITVKAISDFRTRYLNLNREAVRILKKERQKKELGLPHNANAGSFLERTEETEEEHELRVKETLLQSPTYREKLKEISEATLDGPRMIKELVALIQSRLEVYFNEIASGSTIGNTIKADKQFAEYVGLMKDLVKDAKKIEDEYNTQPDAGQVQLNVVHEQIGLIRDTVKDLLNEFAPELALEFMDRLNRKLTTLKYEPPNAPDILEHVAKLEQKIKEMKADDGDQ
jgi:hypothetical protein